MKWKIYREINSSESRRQTEWIHYVVKIINGRRYYLSYHRKEKRIAVAGLMKPEKLIRWDEIKKQIMEDAEK